MKNKNLVVVGSYLVALVMNSKRIPVAGETLMASNFRQVHGGKGSNQAVQAARLGAATSFIGRVGNDSFGSGFIGLCEHEGINADHVYKSQALPTGAGFIICDEYGTNIITIDIGAINEFDARDVDAAMHIITAGTQVLLQLEIPLATALHAARRAKEKGATVTLNPAPAQDLTGCDLSIVDYLTPNETEARICLGLPPDIALSDEDIARQLLQLGCSNVVITLGEKGCLFCNGSTMLHVPGFKVDVVDTTGAGDGFNAALAVALSEGKTIEDALRFANAVAGLAVTKADTTPSYHTRTQVDEFLAMSSNSVQPLGAAALS